MARRALDGQAEFERFAGWSKLCRSGQHRRCAAEGWPCACECAFHHPEQVAGYEDARSGRQWHREPKIEANTVGADAKAGWSGLCRRDEHLACEHAEAVCDCPHHGPGGQRPSRKESTMPRGIKGSGPYGNAALKDRGNPLDRQRDTSRGNGTKPKPVFELVKEQPPDPPPTHKTMVELTRPLLEEIVAKGDADWYRIATYPSTAGAGIAKGFLTKAHLDTEWEFRSVKLEEAGQSAIYARWLGTSIAP